MNSFEQLAAHSKNYAQLLLRISENRLELLAVEMQEELHRIFWLIMLTLGVAVFGLLAVITLTAALVLIMHFPPSTVLLFFTGIYTGAGLLVYWRLSKLLGNWQIFAASIGQVRKDRHNREATTA